MQSTEMAVHGGKSPLPFSSIRLLYSSPPSVRSVPGPFGSNAASAGRRTAVRESVSRTALAALAVLPPLLGSRSP